ncbi:MAG: hypothetical protein ACFE0R_10720 [Salinarimonas sp.]
MEVPMRSRLPALVLAGAFLAAGPAIAQDSAISFFLLDRAATDATGEPAVDGSAAALEPVAPETSLLDALSRAAEGRAFGAAVSAAAPGRSGMSGRDFGAAVSAAASGRGSDDSDAGGSSDASAGSDVGATSDSGGGGGAGNGGGGNGNGGGNGRP